MAWMLLTLVLSQPLNSASLTSEERAGAANVTVDQVDLSGTEAAVIENLNRFRASQGRKPLRVSATRMDGARRYTAWMAAHRIFTHSPTAMNAYSGVGENIARGQTGAREVIGDWSRSPGHCRTMLDSWESVGIGVYRDSQNVWYWTAQFSR